MTIKLYGERDLEMLDMTNNYYSRNIMAMTAEGLNSKSAIAAELAYRDWIIDNLKWLCDTRLKEINNLKDKLNDLHL